MDITLRTRKDAVKLFLDTISPLKPFYSPCHAFLHLGNTGVHYGEKSARMEGFARILWGLGPLWSADNKNLPKEEQGEIREWLELYREGIIHGTTPEDEEYWGDIFDYDQKMVEVAAVVFAIAINRDKLWDPLEEREKKNLYNWLRQMNEHDMPKNNWRYFRILTNMMFRLLGLEWSKERLEEDFGLMESFYTGDGWYCDGNPGQVDYYVAFAIHYYGLLYAKLMDGMEPERCRLLRERSTQFYNDYVYWFANNGEEIPFGRSLTYRYAHCGPFGAMAYADLDVDYGVLKNLTLRNLESWMRRPVFDHSGILTIGYGYPSLSMSESYNGCGSPYWCNKAFLILGLNEDHPFWKAEPRDYPYEPKKLLIHPHMLITHDQYGHAQAYVAGQHLKHNHGGGPEKYEKFVYSNQFGFSVSKGTGLAEGAFDNTLAVSLKGENRYFMRWGQHDFSINHQTLTSRYSPIPGVTIESTVIPCFSWHVRIHKISNSIPVEAADGGFAIPQENCFQLEKGRKSGKFEAEDVKAEGNSLFAVFPWGISGIIGETGGMPELVSAFPNTNLLYNLTVIPTVRAVYEEGTHVMVTSVFADKSPEAEILMKEKPQVEILEKQIHVIYKGECVKVLL